MVDFYTVATDMTAEKTASVIFRVSPKLKARLEIAAAQQNPIQTNMLETLGFSHYG